MGEMIVDGYADWMSARIRYPHTMSAVDMSKLDELVDAVYLLAGSLTNGMTTYSTQVQMARNATLRFYYRDYIDLYDFAAKIDANIADATISAHAQDVMTKVDAYVLSERHSSTYGASHGVSIFFPTSSSSYYNASNYDFAAGAVWPGAPLPALQLKCSRRLGNPAHAVHRDIPGRAGCQPAPGAGRSTGAQVPIFAGCRPVISAQIFCILFETPPHRRRRKRSVFFLLARAPCRSCRTHRPWPAPGSGG